MGRHGFRLWTYRIAAALAVILPPAIAYGNGPQCIAYGISETKNWVKVNAAKTSVSYSLTVRWACGGGAIPNCIVCETDTLSKYVMRTYLPVSSIHTQDFGTCAENGSHNWVGTFAVLPRNEYEIACFYKGYVPALSVCNDSDNWLTGTRIYVSTY